jgi:SAM-dependent methyltransferase
MASRISQHGSLSSIRDIQRSKQTAVAAKVRIRTQRDHDVCAHGGFQQFVVSNTVGAENWNVEYSRGGIPSSYRQDPSGVLLWALANWNRLTSQPLPVQAIDLGCGTGRNSRHMAKLGISVVGLDYSTTALEQARNGSASLLTRPVFLLADLAEGLPVKAGTFDLACDIFVYKHIIHREARLAYRKEIRRILRPGGYLLLSLADAHDGYYSTCPDISPNCIATQPRTVFDPMANIASVLFSFQELLAELSDTFTLSMSWHKQSQGVMHGTEYLRRTIATIWRSAG